MYLSENHYERADRLLAEIDLCDQELVTGLSSLAYVHQPQCKSHFCIEVPSW